MRIPGIGYGLSICAAAAMLVACGGSQPPIGARSAMPQTSAIATDAAHGTSWMLPEAKSEDLLYIVDKGANRVRVYSYPGLNHVGGLGGFRWPDGDCVDEAGNVWIVSQATDSVIEYAHGGVKPIRNLSLGQQGQINPSSCAVDPLSGDLAVTSIDGGAFVFQAAKGKPKRFFPMPITGLYPAYDNVGNLYVGGYVPFQRYYGRAALSKLAKGSKRFERLPFRPGVNPDDFPIALGLQWTAGRMAMVNGVARYGEPADLYQVQQKGDAVRIVGTTTLAIRGTVGQFWVARQMIFAPFYFLKADKSVAGGVALYHYPSGGEPITTIGDLRQPVAVTFSPARR
jgi:hypothetical protein